MSNLWDVLIIGAGAVGCAVARELSRYDLRITVLEKEADTPFGASGRNSGVVHAGFNNAPGSQKALLCREGCAGFEDLARELCIGYRRTGKLVVGSTEKDLESLTRLKKQGEANDIAGLDILTGDEIRALEPNIRGEYALWSGTTAIFDPFEYTLALAEDAAARGSHFLFGHKVEKLDRVPEGFCVTAAAADGTEKVLEARVVINAAGLFSAAVREMTGDCRYRVRPCRGEYHILERKGPQVVSRPVYPLPDEARGVLGIHLTPTIHGNLMIGPSAEFLPDPEDLATTAPVMEDLLRGARHLLGEDSNLSVIRSFSGIRPKLTDENGDPVEDFVIEEDPRRPGLIHLMGIESPGMTAALPIARRVLKMIREGGRLSLNERCVLPRRGEVFPPVSEAIKGKMICRCESVSEGEIRQALANIRQLGATPTLKGVKNRTRASMGSCQGGFCSVDLSQMPGISKDGPETGLTYDGPGSELFFGHLKGGPVHDQ